MTTLMGRVDDMDKHLEELESMGSKPLRHPRQPRMLRSKPRR